MKSNTIKLKKYSDVIEEYRASGVITPGMLLAYDNNGKVGAHAAKGGSAVAMFALEDELQGRGIGDAYAANDPVQCWLPYRGDQVFALLTGAAVVRGTLLQSAGDGSLEAFSTALANAGVDIKSGDNGLKVTARKPGVEGNAIQIKLVDGTDTITAGAEDVDVDDTSAPGVVIITVTFRSAATASTIAQVIAAINADTDAKALVFAEGIGTTSGAAFEAEKALAGGTEVNFGQVVAQALEAVDPAATTKRIAVRIV